MLIQRLMEKYLYARPIISVVLIGAILAPDLTRAMENEDQKPQKLYRSASLPDLSKLSSPNKSLSLKGTNKPKRSSLNLLAPLKNSLPSKEEIIFQPLNKGCESKKSSSDSNTTSPRKEETVEEIISSKNSSQLSTSSSPEKSNSSESSPKKNNIVSYIGKKDIKQDLLPQLFQNPQELPILIEIKKIEPPKNDSATEKKSTEGTKSEGENKTPIITKQLIQQPKNFGEKLEEELRYDENTPLLLEQKITTQKKPLFPFNKKDKPNKELTLFPIKGSINQSESEHRDFNIEEDTETISQKDHKDKKNGNSDSTDSFLLLEDNLELKDKKGCCCNRPCLPHPELWRKVSDLRNVIESSEEDKLEEKKDLPQIKTSNFLNVTKTVSKEKSSQFSLIVLNDEEQKLTPSLFIEKLKEFDFKQLSQHTKTQLNFIVREIEGPWPKWEWIKNKQWGKLKEWAKNELPGAAIGTGIGAWLAPAMVFVYGSAQDYLVFNFIFAYKQPWKGILDFTAKVAKPYIIPSIALDAVPRNVVVWRKGLTLLREEKVSKKRVFWTAAASLFPSLFEPSYLVLLELELIGIANSEGGDSTPYKKTIYKYTWPLFIDSWTSNFQTTWNMWDDFQEWRQTTSIGCLRSTYIPSEEESLCRDFKKKLDRISKWLYRTASPEQTKSVYEKLKRSEQEVEELFPNLKKEDLPNARAFLGLNEVLSLGDDLEQTQRYIKSWYDIGADILTDFCLVTGSPARLLTLQLIISSMTNLIPLPGWLQWLRHPLNWGLAGAGFIPQTALEHQGLSTFCKEFWAQEEPDGEAIYKNAKTIGGFRVSGKVYALWQGFIFTLPLVVTVFQVVNKWSTTQPGNPYWMIGAATFLFAEYATQVSKQWNWSFQKWVSVGSTIYNSIRNTCSGSSSTQHQRAYILGFIQNAKDRMPYFTPELLHILKGNLDYKNELEKEEKIETKTCLLFFYCTF